MTRKYWQMDARSPLQGSMKGLVSNEPYLKVFPMPACETPSPFQRLVDIRAEIERSIGIPIRDIVSSQEIDYITQRLIDQATQSIIEKLRPE